MNLRENLQKKFAEQTKNYLQKYNVGILHVAQRVGKTFIVYNILKYFPDNITILITYPDNQIKESWETTFNICKYKGNVILCNYDSLKKYENIPFTFFIIDECHSLNESTIALDKCIQIFNNSLYTLGLTGTLNNISKDLLHMHFNMNIILEYTAEQAILDNIIAPYKVIIHTAYLDNIKKFVNKSGKFQTEKQKYDGYTYIIEQFKKQNKDTKFLAIHRNKLSQTSLGKKKVCINILQKLKDKRVIVFCGFISQADNLGIPSYHSKSKKNTMEEFNQFKFNHLALANTGYIGKNYKQLDAVVLLSWTGKDEDTFQKISRSMINDYEDKLSEIHIICINEPAEIKKLNKTLQLLNKHRIEWK